MNEEGPIDFPQHAVSNKELRDASVTNAKKLNAFNVRITIPLKRFFHFIFNKIKTVVFNSFVKLLLGWAGNEKRYFWHLNRIYRQHRIDESIILWTKAICWKGTLAKNNHRKFAIIKFSLLCYIHYTNLFISFSNLQYSSL